MHAVFLSVVVVVFSQMILSSWSDIETYDWCWMTRSRRWRLRRWLTAVVVSWLNVWCSLSSIGWRRQRSTWFLLMGSGKWPSQNDRHKKKKIKKTFFRLFIVIKHWRDSCNYTTKTNGTRQCLDDGLSVQVNSFLFFYYFLTANIYIDRIKENGG